MLEVICDDDFVQIRPEAKWNLTPKEMVWLATLLWIIVDFPTAPTTATITRYTLSLCVFIKHKTHDFVQIS